MVPAGGRGQNLRPLKKPFVAKARLLKGPGACSTGAWLCGKWASRWRSCLSTDQLAVAQPHPATRFQGGGVTIRTGVRAS